MDDKIRRAEDLLAERSRTRTNGHPLPESESEGPESDGSAGSLPEDPKVVELTNDLKRMAADFANYRKRNDAERADFAKFAKADLIAKLLDVLDGYDRALATVPDELKGQPWTRSASGSTPTNTKPWRTCRPPSRRARSSRSTRGHTGYTTRSFVPLW